VAWPVSRQVNTPKNNHSGLIAPESVAVKIEAVASPGAVQLEVDLTPLDPGEPILE
jgi:hypothetical protein